MNRYRVIFTSLALLFSSLACRFTERIVFGEPMPVPTATIAPSPTNSPVPTEGPSPTPSPTITRTPVPQQPVGAACQPNDLNCIYACFDRLALVLPKEDVPPLPGIYGESDATMKLVRYRIDGNQIVEPDTLWVPKDFIPYQQNTLAHERIWNYFAYLVPAENRTMLVKYLVSMRGGGYKYAAYVTATNDTSSQWEMNVNLLDASDSYDMTVVLVHEYGHLITLNDTQVDAEETNCQSLLTGDGCTRPKSYIDAFYRQFWKDIYPEWAKIEEESDPDTHDALLKDFYDKYQTRFVSEYAASDPVEDMAESWTSFVLFSGSSHDDLARQKVAFFKQYPELVALRQTLLDNLCSYQP